MTISRKRTHLVVIGFAVGVSALLVSCGREKKSGKKGLPSPFEKTEAAAGGSSSDGQLNFDRRAVRNFEELKSSIGAVTCVSDDDKLNANGVRTYKQFFRDVAGNLPTSNEVGQYIGANIVATMNLASQACLLSISLPSAAKCEWSAGLRNESDPSTAFTDERVTALAKGVYEHLWRLDMASFSEASPFVTDLKKDVAVLQAAVRDQYKNTNLPGDQLNRKIVEGVLVSVCSAALASTPFTTY